MMVLIQNPFDQSLVFVVLAHREVVGKVAVHMDLVRVVESMHKDLLEDVAHEIEESLQDLARTVIVAAVAFVVLLRLSQFVLIVTAPTSPSSI